MTITMKVSAEKLKAPEPVPDGTYEVRLEGFKPAFSKNKDSLNYNPVLKVVNHPQYEGRQLFFNLNSKADWIIQDFSHAFGEDLVDVGGGEKALAGEFDGDPNNPETWAYRGPLVGRVGKVEAIVGNYQGKARNEIKQFFCGVTNCATLFPGIRHSHDLTKKG